MKKSSVESDFRVDFREKKLEKSSIAMVGARRVNGAFLSNGFSVETRGKKTFETIVTTWRIC